MLNSPRIHGYNDVDKTLSTCCHVYERDDVVHTVQLHSDGLHSGFLFAENNIVTVVTDGSTELIVNSPGGSHRSDVVHVMYLNEKDILSASVDGGVNLWSIADDGQLEWKNYLYGSRNHLSALQVSNPKHEMGNIVATTKDGYLSIWSRETLLPILSAAEGNALCLDHKGLYSVELFDTAGMLAVGGHGRIYMHEGTEASDFSHITTLGGHRGPVLALASHTFTLFGVEGDGGEVTGDCSLRDIVISGGEDKALVVWDARLFEEHSRQPCAHRSAITSIVVLDTAVIGYSPNPMLVSSSRDGFIRLWNLPSLTLVHEIGAHSGVVLQVSATLRYGRFNNRPALLSTGNDQRIKVWRLYRSLNWIRRKNFALFLAQSGFVRSSCVFVIPGLVEVQGRCEAGDGAHGGASVLSSVMRGFYVNEMCRNIASFL